MNRARIIVLAIALAAGGVAAYLVSQSENKPDTQVAAVQNVPTVDVLVAKGDIQLGDKLRSDQLEWQIWADNSASKTFIRRSDRPEAISQLGGWIARSPFVAGEPIRDQKLVKADGSGFMAAILPSGMRAVSTEISAETGAGGFILPNDHVDVILSKRLKSPNPDGAAGPDIITSAVILSNIRVLAIDQAPKEKDGQNAVLGKTATLELKPDDVNVLGKARNSGTLSLALRSIADSKQIDVVAQADSKSITIYKGVAAQDVLTCDPLCRQ
jgi:pilus assembly protein CpaB